VHKNTGYVPYVNKKEVFMTKKN